jgi:hypothetical protein
VARRHDPVAKRDIARGVAATSHAVIVRGGDRVRGSRFRRVPRLVGVERGLRPPRAAPRAAARRAGSLVAFDPGTARRLPAMQRSLEGSRHMRWRISHYLFGDHLEYGKRQSIEIAAAERIGV